MTHTAPPPIASLAKRPSFGQANIAVALYTGAEATAEGDQDDRRQGSGPVGVRAKNKVTGRSVPDAAVYEVVEATDGTKVKFTPRSASRRSSWTAPTPSRPSCPSASWHRLLPDGRLPDPGRRGSEGRRRRERAQAGAALRHARRRGARPRAAPLKTGEAPWSASHQQRWLPWCVTTPTPCGSPCRWPRASSAPPRWSGPPGSPPSSGHHRPDAQPCGRAHPGGHRRQGRGGHRRGAQHGPGEGVRRSPLVPVLFGLEHARGGPWSCASLLREEPRPGTPPSSTPCSRATPSGHRHVLGTVRRGLASDRQRDRGREPEDTAQGIQAGTVLYLLPSITVVTSARRCHRNLKVPAGSADERCMTHPTENHGHPARRRLPPGRRRGPCINPTPGAPGEVLVRGLDVALQRHAMRTTSPTHELPDSHITH